MRLDIDLDQIRSDLDDVRVKAEALASAWGKLPAWVRRRQAAVITLGEGLPDGFCDPESMKPASLDD